MKNQFRKINNSDVEVDVDNQIITFSVASETPFERQDNNDNVYNEILIMSEDVVNLTRLKGGASILKNHDDDQILGTVLDAWIQDRKLYVKAQFRLHDENVKGIFKDICEGIIKNVSLGYIVDEIEFKKENNKTNGYCKITPFEVSVAVGVPADPSVGFYRSITYNCKGMKSMIKNDKVEEKQATETDELEQIEQLKKRIEELEEKMNKELDDDPEQVVEDDEDQTSDQEKDTDVENQSEDTSTEEDKSTDEDEIRAVARAFKREDLIPDALKRKINVNTFKRELKNKINKGNIQIMEQKKFDIAKALRSLVVNNTDAQYERELSREAYRKAGLTVNENAIVYRDFTGVTGAGLLPTTHRGDLFVDILRTKMAVQNAKIVGGLQGTVTIPAATSTSTVAWVEGLNSEAGGTNPTISAVTLTPKKLTAYVDVDKNLIVNGSPEPINLVINDLVAQISRKLDYTILKGNATAPLIAGVNGTTGVNTVTIADISKATFQDFLNFGGAVDAYEMVSAPEFIMSASDKAILKGTSKDVGSGRFICEDNMIDGYNVSVCGALKSGEIYFGNFANVIVGNWLSGLEIVIDPYTLSRSGGYRIVATMIADVAVTNPNGFVKRVSE